MAHLRPTLQSLLLVSGSHTHTESTCLCSAISVEMVGCLSTKPAPNFEHSSVESDRYSGFYFVFLMGIEFYSTIFLVFFGGTKF